MVDVLVSALDALWRQMVFGLGVLFALGALLYAVQWATHRALGRAIGFRGIVWWTGWLGTPVHEISHYVVGKAFGLEIVEVKPFAPDPDTGVLGYVRYIRPPLRLTSLHQVVGTFAMGIAPLFGGALVLWAAWLLLVQPAASGDHAREVLEFTETMTSGGPVDVFSGFFELTSSLYAAVFGAGLARWQPWVFLYVALAIGAHLAPSTADLRGGTWGFVVLCALAYVANVIALAVGASPADAVAPLAGAGAAVSGLLVLALILNAGNLALATVLSFATQRLRG